MKLSAAKSRNFAFFGLAVLLACAAAALAQQPAASNRVLGTVTAVSGTSVTVKTDAGSSVEVTVPDTAKILKTAPGQKTLAGATKIGLSDIQPGDRVLMLAPGNPPTAAIVIVNKKSDLEAFQAQQQEEWERKGVGGLVKAVDPANGTVSIASGKRTITIHTTPSTVIRRYAPDSVKFSDAQPSTLDAIHPGDQLRARGTKSADGTELTADAIVSGSFRNIAGLVTSVDASAGSFRVKDWMTKKTVTIHTTADSDMRKLQPQVAEKIAAELRAAGGQGKEGASGGHESAAAWHGNHGGGPGPAAGGGASSLAQILAQSPEIHVGDLHKGDAVIIVATSGNPDSATAIRVVTGVEPMLRASASGSQSMFSSAWSLGGGSSAPSAEGDMGAGGSPPQH